MLIISNDTKAQQSDTTKVAAINGVLRDSVHNYVMQSATVSIYRQSDGKLLSYQFSNNFGQFKFKSLPANTELKVIATNIGYMPTDISFKLKPDTDKDLGVLNMTKANINLKEVEIVAKPPMQMKGDTLEFNADAFKLDTNAVLEDVIRRLPGVTVWRDGVITVNGKKISRLLVDGKDFFGSDPRIALQNLPKNAVDKIQVYQNKDAMDPINPPTEMNVVLKKDNRSGYFGKFGGGYGSSKRYTSDLMLSFFNPKLQISAIGALNNVNKTADNVTTLMSFNAFKGDGINNDFYTDFRKQGENIFKATGLTAKYDFNKKTNLNTNLFISDSQSDIRKASESIISAGSGEIINQTSKETFKSSNISKKLNAQYAFNSQKFDLNITPNFRNEKSIQTGSQVTKSENTSRGEYSDGNERKDNDLDQTQTNLSFRLKNKRYQVPGTQDFKSFNFDIDYFINNTTSDDLSLRITSFQSTDPIQNKYFNRKYESTSDNTDQSLEMKAEDLLGLFQQRAPWLIFDITNGLSINNRNENNVVSDILSESNQSIQNNALTNRARFRNLTEKPGVSLTKRLFKNLANRYQKFWQVNLAAQGEFSLQNNESDKQFQNLRRNYANILPSATLTYDNNQFGYFQKNFLIDYRTFVSYPSMHQLAPIVDDANIYFVDMGNTHLQSQYKNELMFSFQYDNSASKNPLGGKIQLRATTIKNFITDSIYYDELGRRIRFPINASGYKSISSNGSIQKALKIYNQQFEVSASSNVALIYSPIYISNSYFLSKAINTNSSIELSCNFYGRVNATLRQSLSTSKLLQGEFEDSFRNWGTNLDINMSVNKALSIGSKIDFNKTALTYSKNVNFTIINADVTYRFLKGSNGEVKFSALDLLRENKSVYNFIGNNSLTTQNVNVLKQYFMITMTYYPRNFQIRKNK